MEKPIGRVFPWVAPLLADEHRPLRVLAAKCLRACATRDEKLLAAVFPYLTYDSGCRGEQLEAEDLAVRRGAIRSLYFQHGSKLVQDNLLLAFDRSGLEIKRQLTNAFVYCPEPEDLKRAMLDRVQGDDAENALSAWFVLGIFRDSGLRPRFLEAALSDEGERVYAGLVGLFPFLSEEDAEVLEQVRDRWRPASAGGGG